MALTATQKKTAQAIVNIFETGKVHGEYGQVTAEWQRRQAREPGRSRSGQAGSGFPIVRPGSCCRS